VLRVPLTRDHLAVISGITAQGRLLVAVQARALRGGDVVRFLQHLGGQLGGKLLIIWDGAPIHRARAGKAFLVAGAAGQIYLEQLPGYAPDLNPDESVWDHLKNVELRNVSCHDQEELCHELRLAITWLRHRPDLIRGFHQTLWILALNAAISSLLQGVTEQSRDATKRSAQLLALRQAYHAKLHAPQASALPLRLVDELFASPTITAAQAAVLLHVTPRSAQLNIDKLIAAGILREATGRPRNRAFIAPEIISTVEAAEAR